ITTALEERYAKDEAEKKALAETGEEQTAQPADETAGEWTEYRGDGMAWAQKGDQIMRYPDWTPIIGHHLTILGVRYRRRVQKERESNKCSQAHADRAKGGACG